MLLVICQKLSKKNESISLLGKLIPLKMLRNGEGDMWSSFPCKSMSILGWVFEQSPFRDLKWCSAHLHLWCFEVGPVHRRPWCYSPKKEKEKTTTRQAPAAQTPLVVFFGGRSVAITNRKSIWLMWVPSSFIDVGCVSLLWGTPPRSTSTDALFLLKETQGIFQRSLMLGHVTRPTDLITPKKKQLRFFIRVVSV